MAQSKYLDLQGLITYDQEIKQYIDNSTPESITSGDLEKLLFRIEDISFKNGEGEYDYEKWPDSGEQSSFSRDVVYIKVNFGSQISNNVLEGFEIHLNDQVYTFTSRYDSDYKTFRYYTQYLTNYSQGDIITLWFNGQQYGGELELEYNYVVEP